MSRKIWELFGMLIFTLTVLTALDKLMPSEGQIFQIVAGIVGVIGAVFYSAVRHEFGIPDDKPGTTVTATSVTSTSTTVVPPGDQAPNGQKAGI